MLLGERNPGSPQKNGACHDLATDLSARHASGANFGLVDGHVEYASFRAGNQLAAANAIVAKKWLLNPRGTEVQLLLKYGVQATAATEQGFATVINVANVLDVAKYPIAFYRKRTSTLNAPNDGHPAATYAAPIVDAASGVQVTFTNTGAVAYHPHGAQVANNQRWFTAVMDYRGLLHSYGYENACGYDGAGPTNNATYTGTYLNKWPGEAHGNNKTPLACASITLPTAAGVKKYQVAVVVVAAKDDQSKNVVATCAIAPTGFHPSTSVMAAQGVWQFTTTGNKDWGILQTTIDRNSQVYLRDHGYDDAAGTACVGLFGIFLEPYTE
jgi:prepilin-type processing-associated H-X9-DG protein